LVSESSGEGEGFRTDVFVSPVVHNSWTCAMSAQLERRNKNSAKERFFTFSSINRLSA
jgi:hypothetical protein